MKKLGIYTESQIAKIIEEYGDERSNKEIAAEAHVYPKAVEKIRQKVEKRRQKIERARQARETKAPNSECTKKEPARTNQQVKNEGASTKPIEISPELEKEIRQKLAVYPAVVSIAKTLRVSEQVVLQVQQQMEQEKYDRTHTERDFKIKRIELLSRLKSNVNISDVVAQTIEFKADTLLTEFSKFLTTEEDYKLIAYAYVKAKKYQKAIELGEEYLGLDTPSIGALEQKLREDTIQTDKKKSVGGDAIKIDKKPGDEEFSL